ncbi:uncharacterized protein BDW43DRAFT_273367 [Aspergillus alliaceus]|uniref:uncharacterized protein n=1 Tax=Petromyces alliaceus TaxID=209559 RepID=UPI0012A565FF|nr:uncharacterized protein BDW43DRAFT_273367 [Aspergillus alliaceus]KAB8234513.1 hypothetical protein BDW43DRAFT_273367 [Aspergillus alliaceus]
MGMLIEHRIQNMFSYTQRKPHAARKRVVASLYSKSTLYSSPEMMIISRILVKERVLSILDKRARDKSPADVLELGSSFAMDFICAYLFRIKCVPDFLRCETSRRDWSGAHRRTNMGFGLSSRVWYLSCEGWG